MMFTARPIAADRAPSFRLVYLVSLLTAAVWLLSCCHALTSSTDRVKVNLNVCYTRLNPKALVRSRMIVILHSTRDSDRGKRKRRSKVAIESKVVSSSKPVSDVQDRITTKAMDTPMETMTSTISGFDESFITNRLSDSKLPPLRGTVQEKQSLYNQKNAVQRYIDEVLAPTPVGQEPKLSQLAKTITWVAVLLLVLTEIFVSIKVGGMPFDLSGNGQLIKPPDTPAISIPTGPME